jgi:hypothetical protein
MSRQPRHSWSTADGVSFDHCYANNPLCIPHSNRDANTSRCPHHPLQYRFSLLYSIATFTVPWTCNVLLSYMPSAGQSHWGLVSAALA